MLTLTLASVVAEAAKDDPSVYERLNDAWTLGVAIVAVIISVIALFVQHSNESESNVIARRAEKIASDALQVNKEMARREYIRDLGGVAEVRRLLLRYSEIHGENWKDPELDKIFRGIWLNMESLRIIPDAGSKARRTLAQATDILVTINEIRWTLCRMEEMGAEGRVMDRLLGDFALVPKYFQIVGSLLQKIPALEDESIVWGFYTEMLNQGLRSAEDVRGKVKAEYRKIAG